MKTVICDIDGTLADLTHRLHYIKNGNRQWDEFLAAAFDDKPIRSVIEVVNALYDQGMKIVLVSGRSDKIRGITVDWLNQYNIPFDDLHMRVEGDYRQDFIVKSQILDGILSDGHDILCVIDDRPSVVEMWRARGLTCLQCAQWQEGGHSEVVTHGHLTLMVGPTGAGKTSWLKSTAVEHSAAIISSDGLRKELCGDHKDQSKNDQVFTALHDVARAR